MSSAATARKIAATFEALLADLGSDASRRGYRIDWGQFTSWLAAEEIPVLKVTPKDVKKYVLHLSRRGKARRTRDRALSVIRGVYGALVADELLAVNPAREVKNTKQGKGDEPVTWLEEEALARFLAFGGPGSKLSAYSDKSNGDALIGWTDRRDRMCIQLLAGTGRRREEVARMRVEDFGEHGVTGVVKGGAEKTAPVPEWLRAELASWLAFAEIVAGPVLPWSPGDPGAINGDKVYAIVKRVASVVGIPPEKISPHGLRRTLATLSERRNVPLRDLQAQLGHQSQATTEGYLKGSRRVAEAPGEWMGEMVRPKAV